ncbi:hypothetical protein [Kitasatospora sp. NPDC057223]|uniref:hypothetical protein n=1 Tax=Kitasatospora sp. NPDC057223 TaxID=3346055 RepID=UPI00362FFABA
MALAELDYLLTAKVSEPIAIEAVKRPNALPQLGTGRTPVITTDLQRQEKELMVRYEGHAIGVTDMMNAELCWELQTPVILSPDRHYSNVIAPADRARSRRRSCSPGRRSLLRARRGRLR